MRICYLANAASIHTYRWAEHFADKGNQVTVISFTTGSIPGATVHVVGRRAWAGRFGSYLLGLPEVRRVVRDCQPDILHAHYAGGYGLLAALAGWRPFVITAWGSDVLVAAQKSSVLRALISRSLRHADLVTSMAEHMTAVIHRLGVKRERIVTLPFGVDTSVFHPAGRGGIKDVGTPLIVSTRHFEPVYNVGFLVEALPHVFAAHPTARAMIIGEGTQRARLQRRARDLRISDRAEFVGRLSQFEVAEALRRADVFVSTASSDGNNVSLNEAMACAAFPIVTDIAANREWVVDNYNGLLVNSSDPYALARQILIALDNQPLRQAAANRNWAIIQQRGSWERAMAHMKELYEYLLKQHRGTASASAGLPLVPPR